MIEDGLQYGRYDNPQIFVSSFIKHPDVIVVGNNDDGKELAERIDRQVNHPRRIPVDRSCKGQIDKYDQTGKLDDGCQKLKYEHIRQSQQSHLFICFLEDHLMVDTKCLEQSSCPTGTLTVKHRQVGRSFRPTASIRNLNNLIRTGEVAHISYHAGNEVHIFCKGSTVVSSGCNGYGTVEKTESTGNIRHTIDCRPSHLTNQVGTHVFEVLEKRNRSTRSSHVYYLPVFHYASVCHQHRSADCDYLFIGRYDGRYTAVKSIFL